MITPKLLEQNQLAIKKAEGYTKKRFIFSDLLHSFSSNKAFHALVGPRGVGKTILLLQIGLQVKDSFYLSMDQLAPDTDLFSLVKNLVHDYKVKIVLIDEIHFCKNFEQSLKALNDFLDIKVFVTSSASLALKDMAIDLSRRLKIIYLHPFSFREFLFFQNDVLLPTLTLSQIFSGDYESSHLTYAHLLKEYMTGRLFPFALNEPQSIDLFAGILKKILYKDMAAISKLGLHELKIIEKLLAFIGRSSVDGINNSSLSKNLGITKYKAEEYVELLKKTFILNPIYPQGANVIREPKILMNLPYRNLYLSYELCVGGLREDGLIEWLKIAGYSSMNYLKSTRGEKTPDFLIEDSEMGPVVIELGGKGKGRSQFKGIDSKFKKMIVVDSAHSPKSAESAGAEIATNKLARKQFPLVLFGFLS